MDNLVILLSFLTFCTQHYLGKGLKPLEVTSVEYEDLLEDVDGSGSDVIVVKPDHLPSPINKIFPKFNNNLNYNNESSSEESDSDLSSNFSDLVDDDDDDEEHHDKDDYNEPTRGFNVKKGVLRWSDSCNNKAAKQCMKACVIALKDACNEFHCRKSMKKSFKKECKKECKAVFSSYHMLRIL